MTHTDSRAVDAGPWRVRFDTIPNRGHVDHRQVKPGESTEVVINLNDPPFTFKYVYEGIEKHLVAPVRFLAPGTYRVQVTVALENPFGPGYHEWTGPVTTEPAEFTISKAGAHGSRTPPTKEEIAAYDDAIDRVTAKFGPGGLWLNGRVPLIKLPADAKPEDVVAAAVNTHSLRSKAYRVLRIRPVARLGERVSAAVVQAGGKPKVLVFFPAGNGTWWTRFYDAGIVLPTTQPATAPR